MNVIRVLAVFSTVALLSTGCSTDPNEPSTATSNQAVTKPAVEIGRGAESADAAVYASDSTNIFSGTVTEVVGHEKRGIIPESQVRVSVSENLKGSVPEIVVVNLYNSLMEAPEDYQESDDHDAPEGLRVITGQEYIFYTRFNEEQNWFTVSNPLMVEEVTSSRARSAQNQGAVDRAREMIAQRKQSTRPDGSLLPIAEGLELRENALVQTPVSSTALPNTEPAPPSSTQQEIDPEGEGG